MKFPEKIDENLAYILGALQDGSLIYSERKKYWIRFYDSKDSSWLNFVSKIFEDVFDIKLHLRYQKKINVKYLDISCKEIFYFLRDLVDGNPHGDIPKVVKESNMEIKKIYITGFFDAEGYVPYPSVKNKRFRITFNQKNKDSLIFIKQILESLGIKTVKITQHILPIYGKDNLIKFYNNFELKNPEKVKRLKFLILDS